MTTTVDYVDNNVEEDNNLLERKKSQRTCTDLPHLFMFSMFFTLWIGISIYAFSAGYQPAKEDWKKAMNEISTQLIKYRYVCASFIWLGILFLGLYFIAIRFLTKYVIYTTMFMEFVLLGLLSILILTLVPPHIVKFLFVIILLISFVFYGFTIYAFKKVGYRIMSSIIQDSCKAMKCQPVSVIIVIIQTILMGIVGLFSFFVIFGLSTIPAREQKAGIDPPVYVCFLLFAFASCSLWIMTVIYNVGRTVLYGIFSTWYRTVDKTLIPYTVSLRITHTTLRYHLGTLTFGSTIFTAVQIIRAIYNGWIDLYEKFKTKKMSIFCFMIVLDNATSNTFVVCVNYGTGYYRSMQDSFKLLMKNPLKFAVTRIVIEWMIFFGAVFIPGLTLFFAAIYIIPRSHDYDMPGIPMTIIAGITVSITTVFLETFYASSTAILYCLLEDLSHKHILNDDNDEDVSLTTGGA